MGGFVSCVAINLCECACCCACACCKSFLNATLAQLSRLGHLLLVLSLFTFSVILGQSSPQGVNSYNNYSGIQLDENCDKDYMDECIYRQLVYRASFTLVILFAILAVSSACTEYVNRSFWVLKFGVAFLVFFCFWWGENSFFSGWAQFSRVMAFFWLLVQALLLLDFAYDCHEVIMLKADNASNQSESSRKGWLGFYLLLCVSCLVAAVVGLVFLFSDYSECDLGAFFSSITLIFGVFTTIVSVLEVVNKGLLAPSIMFAYSVFMCWYALLSSPDEECNPSADTNSSNKTTSLVVIALVTGAVLLYCVVNGTLILNIFNTEGEGVMVGQHARPGQKSDNFSAAGGGGVTTSQPLDVESPGNSGNSGIQQESSGTGHEIVFFHVMMMLVTYM